MIKVDKNKKINKLWGGAFEQSPEEDVITFTEGRDVNGQEAVDYKLLPYDIWGNKAHCIMLFEAGIISKSDAKMILQGLNKIQKLAEKKEFILDPKKEDVHTNIESFLTDEYGIGIAGKLHTGRSRNDQSNLDTRLYLKDQVLIFAENMAELAKSLAKQADLYKEIPMPGFTHQQHAMVTTFGHVLMTFSSMVLRDVKRMTNWINLHNTSPLGSAASYGTSFPINQVLTASLLGFDGVDTSSLDYITNRWEPEADLAFAISVFMNHLSIMAETLILFSTPEFDMVKISDRYSTGSSMMPQKKNPDSLEVMKGKSAMAAGVLQSLIGTGKSKIIGYNRDSQWTKYFITDLVSECILAPVIMKGIIESLNVNKEKMLYWSGKGFIGATSLLEQISWRNKISFRQAKILIEKAVKYSEDKDFISYAGLKKALLEEKIDIAISEQNVKDWQDPVKILKTTSSIGGPGLKNVTKSISLILDELVKLESVIKKSQKQKQNSLNLTQKYMNKIVGGAN